MPRLDRETFLARLQGHPIDLQKLQDLPTKVRQKITQADRNNDSKIAGQNELKALFTNLDTLDSNGSVKSVDPRDTQVSRTLDALAQAAGMTKEELCRPETPLQRLCRRNPSLKTNQDLINHFIRSAGGGRSRSAFSRAQRIAKRFGVDMNELVEDRDALVFPPRPQARPERTEQPQQPVVEPDRGATDVAGTGTPDTATPAGTVPPDRATRTNLNAGADPDAAPGIETSPITPAVVDPPATEPRVVPSSRTLRPVYLSNEQDAGRAELRLTRNHQTQITRFQRIYEQNRARYERVSQATGIPPEMVAAIHYRESSMNFGTYLHNGQRLGRTTTVVPRGIYFGADQWEEAAIHALRQKDSVRRQLGITAETRNPAALATFAERYNGLGYHNRGLASPYAWSGTNIYTGGRYVRDHVFDRNSWDQRPGCIALMASLRGGDLGPGVANQTPEEAWEQVKAGHERLRKGVRTPAVTFVQGLLNGLGYELEVDGDFGRLTDAAVRDFQRKYRDKMRENFDPEFEFIVDGVVGQSTAYAMLAELRTRQDANPEKSQED